MFYNQDQQIPPTQRNFSAKSLSQTFLFSKCSTCVLQQLRLVAPSSFFVFKIPTKTTLSHKNPSAKSTSHDDQPNTAHLRIWKLAATPGRPFALARTVTVRRGWFRPPQDPTSVIQMQPVRTGTTMGTRTRVLIPTKITLSDPCPRCEREYNKGGREKGRGATLAVFARPSRGGGRWRDGLWGSNQSWCFSEIFGVGKRAEGCKGATSGDSFPLVSLPNYQAKK